MEFLKTFLITALIAAIALIACGTPALIRIKEPAVTGTWLQGGGGPDRTAYAAVVSDAEPKLLWTKQLKTPLLLEPTASMGAMILPTANRRFDIVSAKDGTYLGEVKARGTIAAPCPIQDSLVVINEFGQHLKVQNWISKEISWGTDLNNTTLEPLVMSGRVYWFDGDKNLNCYDLREGKRIWDKRFENGITTPPGASATKLAVVSDANEVRCISSENGDLLWGYNASSRVRNAPIFCDSCVIISTIDGEIVKLDANNGSEIWKANTNSRIFAPVASDGNAVYAGTNDGQLIKVDFATGQVEWKVNIDGPIKAGLTIAGNYVVMAGLNHHVYFIDKVTGDIKLDQETGGMLSARPVVYMDRVYVAGEDKCLYCFKLTKED